MIQFTERGGGTTSKGAAQIVCGTDGSRLCLQRRATPSATACTPCFTSTTRSHHLLLSAAWDGQGHRVLVFR
ncbi:MAG: hypothetical protein KatS3mg038_2092 [Candidatus Kapaibacterium sp.]|nr:MAG: hypothetical protein KatS3mg038_2092 [Candidatus Kapabacteria bacterium]